MELTYVEGIASSFKSALRKLKVKKNHLYLNIFQKNIYFDSIILGLRTIQNSFC